MKDLADEFAAAIDLAAAELLAEQIELSMNQAALVADATARAHAALDALAAENNAASTRYRARVEAAFRVWRERSEQRNFEYLNGKPAEEPPQKPAEAPPQQPAPPEEAPSAPPEREAA